MLTERLEKVLVNKNSPIDLHAELREVLGWSGLRPGDSGGEITFVGADPVLSSALALASAASIALVARSVAIATLWQFRGGPGQDISMDMRKAPHRICPFYDRKWETLNGFPTDTWDSSPVIQPQLSRAADDRWVLTVPVYPRPKTDMLRFLGATDSMESVRDQIGRRDSTELETSAAAAGVVLTTVRSLEEFMTERHYIEALADAPLIEIEKIGDSDPEPLPTAASAPLDGIRALGHGKVIAGAGIGRTLSLHGADVLNIWPRNELEAEIFYHTTGVGVRSARLDLDTSAGSATMRELLRGADIFYSNRRPGYRRRHGLTAQQAAEIRPGIIHVTGTMFGETGPWADRPGYDENACAATGFYVLEGAADAPQLPPTVLVNDWLIPWLATTAITTALMRRAQEGGSYRIHMSLARTALWVLSLGLFDKQYADALADSDDNHRYLDPDLFTTECPLGTYQGVTDQVHMSQTPGRYPFALLPRGSNHPEWLPRTGGDR
ncbi:CoA transferase [Nocardia sp. NPDC051570]|uniref:CoA transferase n=1 Tax=Nocardia sp. NPDC051570 TaxID=3364324 RepID=UPI0037B25E9F